MEIREKQPGGFLNKFFMIMGILFVVFIVVTVGIFITLMIIKPFGLEIQKIIPALIENKINSDKTAPESLPKYDHPILNTEQEALLESVGIDTATLPTEVTPAQINCATEALGAPRVLEIKNGAMPTFGEILKTQHCL